MAKWCQLSQLAAVKQTLNNNASQVRTPDLALVLLNVRHFKFFPFCSAAGRSEDNAFFFLNKNQYRQESVSDDT